MIFILTNIKISQENPTSQSEKKKPKDVASIQKAPFASFEPPGGGILPYKRLMGMCRWMGSHFYNWIDYNGVTFLAWLLERGRTFSGFLG